MNNVTIEMLFKDFVSERRALGYSYNTDFKVIKRFLSDYDVNKGDTIEFTKEYVLSHIQRKPNQSVNTQLRDISAIKCFLGFVTRKGYKTYHIPPKSLPREQRNFKAYIFSKEEIERILKVTDTIPYNSQCPNRHFQLPVMFRILFNCGLRISELLKLKVSDVDMENNVFSILDTKFNKNRLVPFSDEMADVLKKYFINVPPLSDNSWLFCSPKENERYSLSGFHSHFQMILRLAGISRGGKGIGPRPHDIRHTFAVHCLNNWVESGVDIMAALPVLSRYMGHSGLKGTQKYLQLTASMFPHIIESLEYQFGELIPTMEVGYEAI